MWKFLSGSCDVSKCLALFSDSWDAENEIDNIDEISLFDEGNQHVLELNGNLSNINLNNPTIWKVEEKLKEVATELLKNWKQRQTKNLQTTTFKVFATIHEINNQDPIQHEIRLRLLEKVINSLPPRQQNSLTKILFLQDF